MEGSLCYLANFKFEDHEKLIRLIFEGIITPGIKGVQDNYALGLDNRSRLIVTAEGRKDEDHKRDMYLGANLDAEIAKNNIWTIKERHILNEVVVDRGPSPWSTTLEIYINEKFLVKTSGDGLIIATPTGSTAYNMATGGSLVQTNTDCINLTPLAQHALSWRPLILPSTAEIRVKKTADGRGKAWVSLDGANRFPLDDGESIVITGSDHPLRFVTYKTDDLTDLWVQRLVNKLGWADTHEQKVLK